MSTSSTFLHDHRRTAFAAFAVLLIIALLPVLPAQGGSPRGPAGKTPTIKGPFVSRAVKPLHFTGSVKRLPKTAHITKGYKIVGGKENESDLEGVGSQLANAPYAGQEQVFAKLTRASDPFLAHPPRVFSGGSRVDAALPAAPGPGTAPTEFTTANPNFDGIPATGFVPPDTNGDVGPNHYIQTVNSSFQIFNKQGTSLAGPSAINSLWSAVGGPEPNCANNNNGDPYVVYDHLADRWVISQFALPNGLFNNPSYECIAVSQTPNPVAGGWFLYEFQVQDKFDYPKLGLWNDGYYFSGQEGFSGGSLDAYVVDRANMLNGNPATLQRFSIGGPALILLPGDLDGPAPGNNAPEVFGRAIDGDSWGGSDRVELYNFHTDWQQPGNSTFTSAASLAIGAFDDTMCGNTLNNNCIPQPGSGTTLATLSVWSMGPLQYRVMNGYDSVVFNQTADADGSDHAGVRWWELRKTSGTWGVTQDALFAPDSGAAGLADDVDRWMGSIAQDKAGDMALGYSAGNGTVSAGIRYAGRLASDPFGLLPQGSPGSGAPGSGEVTLISGSGAQASNRYGDYSAMRIDPTDGCTFWYTTEYLSSGNWRTRIAAFRFPTCNPADVAVTQTASPSPVTAGTAITYTVTAKNNGPDPATNVVVTDDLTAGNLDFVSSTGSCVEAPANKLTCQVGSLASGASSSFTVRADVDGDAIANGASTVKATAAVTATQLDPDTSNNTAVTTTALRESADLAVTKTCDSTLYAGQTGKCTIFVDNAGPSAARNVAVTDNLSSDGVFTVTSVSGSPGSPSCTSNTFAPTSTATASCQFTKISAASASNTGRATMEVKFTATEAQTVSDVAKAASDTPDPRSTNNSASASVPVTASADLKIQSLTATGSGTAGTNLTYDVTVKNDGPSTAHNVVVQDAVPGGVKIVSVAGPGATQCNAGVPGDPLQPATCGFDVMAPGATRTMTIVVTIDPATTGILHDDARVSAVTFDPDNSNNLAHVDTPVVVTSALSLTLDDSPDWVAAGTVLTYTATVTNAGPSLARSVTLNETMDTRTTLNGTDISNGGSGTCAPNSGLPGSLTCHLNDLGPGKSVVVHTTVTVRPNVPDGSSLSLTGTADATGSPQASDSESTAVKSVADLYLTYIGPAKYKPSANVVYVNTVTNYGPADAAGVKLIDNLPAAKVGKYVSDNGGTGVCSISGATLTCNLGTLPAGVTRVIQVTYYVQGNAKLVTSTASVSETPSTDPGPSVNTASWSMSPK